MKQEVSNAELRNENLKLKDQIVEMSKTFKNFATHSTEESVGIIRKPSTTAVKLSPQIEIGIDKKLKEHSKSHAKLIKTLDTQLNKENIRPNVPTKTRPNKKADGGRTSDLDKSNTALKSHFQLRIKDQSAITASKRQNSVSLLGQKLVSLEEELREERNLNSQIKRKISKLLVDNNMMTPVESRPSEDQRSTTKTVDGKRGHVLQAFSKFAEKIKQLQSTN